MSEFYEGQSVYLCPIDSNNTWLRGVVRHLNADGLVKLVEVDIHYPSGCQPIVVRLDEFVGELVRGDAG